MKQLRYAVFLLLILPSSIFAQHISWTSTAPFKGEARDAAISFAIGTNLYIGGGEGFKDFWMYNTLTNEWKQLADLPSGHQERSFAMGFAVNDKGYMGLGYDTSDAQGNNHLLNDFWQYDTTTNVWTRKADFPASARDAAFAFTIGKNGYVGGGYDNQFFLSDFYAYDPVGDTWTQLNDVPYQQGIIFPAAFVLNGFGYLATGATAVGGNMTETKSVFKYDTAQDAWTSEASFPGVARQSGSAFILGGKAYVGIGQEQYTTVFKDFFAYDPVTNTWDSAGSISTPQGRAWASAVSTADKAYLGLGTYFSGNNLIATNNFWNATVSSAGVASIHDESGASAYPNPTHDRLTITLPDAITQARIIIYNAVGVNIRAFDIETNSVDLSGLIPGVYTMEITSDHGHSIQRIVKE